MDIRIKKNKTSKLKKFVTITLLSVSTILIGLWSLSNTSSITDFTINLDALIISEVKQDSFAVTVRAPGVLLSNNVRWLAAEVDGYVENVFVKPGELVSKNQPILQLSNPALTQTLEENQWELEALQAEVISTRLALESRLLDQEAICLESESAWATAKLYFDAESSLLKENKSSISLLKYKETKLLMQQHHQRWKIELRRLTKLKANITAQNTASEARVNKYKKSLQKIKQQVQNLIVRASIDAVVQEIPFEPGQRVKLGEPLSKLATKNDLYGELRIPEVKIRQVNIGQQVSLDTRNSKINGVVTRVDPSVRDGVVKVDIKITDDLPADARPDLSVDGIINIVNIASTLSIKRPVFSQSNSNTSVYKLSTDGNYAHSTSITYGQGSNARIEVISGLQAGDKIIVSDTSAWQSNQIIRLKR